MRYTLVSKVRAKTWCNDCKRPNWGEEKDTDEGAWASLRETLLKENWDTSGDEPLCPGCAYERKIRP